MILLTNSFLFTDLPERFALINLPKIYKNLASYSVNRGVPYVKNRWYIEAVKIKHDGKGLWADITLNAFPSDQSSFASAMEQYINEYDNAYNKKTTSTASTTGTSTGSTGLVKSTGNTQLDNLIKGWINGKTSQLDKAIAVHNGLKAYGIRYQRYNNFKKSNGSISKAFQQAHNGLNCGDTAVLTVGSMRAADLNAYIGFRCDHAHFFTVIVINNTKYYSDLVWSEGAYSQRPWNQTWQNNKCHSQYNGVNIH